MIYTISKQSLDNILRYERDREFRRLTKENRIESTITVEEHFNRWKVAIENKKAVK